ncbi:MAG: STT3 domain-containing protein [Candidatus Nanoarchaeia archaeon]|nr:STT3 domain-containing protein [Candidatus Nanoarchaeia archaeon]MDD5587632.1 STT3 domain-containing protein [Candidatus Nanoarchaeia archaeon]
MEHENKNTEIEKRKEEFIKKIKENKKAIGYVVLAIIIWFSYWLRTLNLKLLTDVTTGKYIPSELDSFVFLRYAKDILAHGSLFVHDMLRYAPLGFDTNQEANLLSYVVVYIYKFLHIFTSKVTLEYVDIIYPAVFFCISLIFFYLLIKRLFNSDAVALLSCAFLSVIPGYLYRTMTGFADKEALGLCLMFLTFYLFVLSYQEKKLNKSLIYSALAAIATFFMARGWGGTSFVFMIIGLFVLIEIFFSKFNEKDIFSYLLYVILLTLLLLVLLPGRYSLGVLFTSLTSAVMYLAFAVSILYYLVYYKNIFKLKEKVDKKMPVSVFCLIATFVAGALALLPFAGRAIFNELNGLYLTLTQPFGYNRWILTVAESHQPFFNPDWLSQMNMFFILLAIVGSIILFYNLVKPLEKNVKKLTFIYGLFVFAFIFSRYSSDSVLNGSNSISLWLYLGSLIVFIGILTYSYLKSFYKDHNIFLKIKELNKDYIFIFTWFIVMVIAARSAIRLLVVLIPIATMLTSYFVIYLINYFKNNERYKENNYYIWVALIVIAVVIFFIFVPFTRAVYNQAIHSGPAYNNQWQVAGGFIRNNTAPDAIFAHWWDYGYYVQGGFDRPTITDGGNYIYAWNHWMGRNVLTGHSEQEALDFLYPHNASYLLIISDEVGKYPAFSSIGADANYDRYSWIPTYSLDDKNIQETRNELVYPYTGGTMLDKDIIYNDVVLPKGIAGIAGFLVPIERDNKTLVNFKQPTAVVVYNSNRYDIPINCIFFNKKQYTFNNINGINGCLMIIPIITGQQMNMLGSALYLSPEVSQTLFTHLYLFGEESKNFELFYSDETSMPLAIYSGYGLLGPLKIWKINYPSDLKYNATYLDLELSDTSVMKV